MIIPISYPIINVNLFKKKMQSYSVTASTMEEENIGIRNNTAATHLSMKRY